MATLTATVTDMPVDLVADLGLTVGTRYLIEAVAGHPSLRLFEGGSSQPSDLSYFHSTGLRLGITPMTATPIWVWSAGESTRVCCTEVRMKFVMPWFAPVAPAKAGDDVDAIGVVAGAIFCHD